MSASLGGTYSATTNAAIASYDSEVKLAYAGASSLRGRVKLKTGVTGQSHFFQKMGQGVATQHTSHELITPADYSHSKVAATLSNWRIGDYTLLRRAGGDVVLVPRRSRGACFRVVLKRARKRS